ncbi:hypothetical protein NEMIN01_0420 [Nematocida minor]|uniref:uncharacterized protein n=1 Tax=Nematocida minor TaxID=1912983 RepID=UPI00222012FC|nr:uncharacterized protein NEMIN01_0420 [Nematocida minor]KAI5189357.1 hypothetical protein NEMIN01_0420 [Nematocida minor]
MAVENSKKASCKEFFRDKGVHFTSGIRYGTDCLVYLDEPGRVHSSFTATAQDSIEFKTLSALVRVSSSTKKDFVLCSSKEKILFARFSRFFL